MEVIAVLTVTMKNPDNAFDGLSVNANISFLMAQLAKRIVSSSPKALYSIAFAMAIQPNTRRLYLLLDACY